MYVVSTVDAVTPAMTHDICSMLTANMTDVVIAEECGVIPQIVNAIRHKKINTHISDKYNYNIVEPKGLRNVSIRNYIAELSAVSHTEDIATILQMPTSVVSGIQQEIFGCDAEIIVSRDELEQEEHILLPDEPSH